MRSNFCSSKQAKISRQMNRSQKLKRKNTCKRHIQLHRSHPGLKNEAEAEARSRTGSHCLLRPKKKNQDHRAGVGQAWATSLERRATTRHRPAGATSCKLKFVLRYVKTVKIWSLNLKFFSVKKFVKLKWDLQNLTPFNLTNKISKLHLQH